jgi:hypothetical protein
VWLGYGREQLRFQNICVDFGVVGEKRRKCEKWFGYVVDDIK